MYRTIRSKMKLIGNEHFNVQSIHKVSGVDRFPELECQITKLQEIVENLTDKFVYYKLGEHYDEDLSIILQSQINEFCKNLIDFNYYLKRISMRPEIDNFEDSSDRIVNRAVAEIEATNKKILNAIMNINDDLSYYIEDHDLKLFPHPQD